MKLAGFLSVTATFTTIKGSSFQHEVGYELKVQEVFQN